MTKFAYRLETKRVKDPDFPYVGKNFAHPEAVAEFCRSLPNSHGRALTEKSYVSHGIPYKSTASMITVCRLLPLEIRY